jgi:hypothetical protein
VVILKMGSQELFAWGWPQTTILLTSASQVARIKDVNHHAWLALCIFFMQLPLSFSKL